MSRETAAVENARGDLADLRSWDALELSARSGQAAGKVMLFGEYAVLEGGVALVSPSPHHASATYAPLESAQGLSRFAHLWSELNASTHERRVTLAAHYLLDAGPLGVALIARSAQGEVEHEIGTSLPFAREVLRRLDAPRGLYRINTANFGVERSGRWEKMGVGSSGAATVALIDLLSASDAQSKFELACSVHHAVQGALGSGADIAASAYGHLIEYRYKPERVVTSVAAPLPYTRCIWSGGSCSTSASVRGVKRWAARDPEGYNAHIERLNAACERACSALRMPYPQAAWVDAVREGADAARRLGERAGVPVWTARHQRWSELITPLGGALKPSGAGGDDLSILTAGSQDALEECLIVLQHDTARVNSTHIDSTHIDSTHIDSTHIDSTHIDSTHIDSTHIDSAALHSFTLS